MRCLLDTSVPHAKKYYETYRWEPSPEGDISIGSSDLVAGGVDLETLLTEMKNLGPKGELLVVTHSNQDGLMMKLMQGAKVSAGFSVMDKILAITNGMRERKAITAMPASKRAKAWQGWFKKFDPGIKLDDGFEVGNNDWEQNVEQWFDQWHDRQGTQILKLPNGGNDLDAFIQLVEDVRKAGFGRLEFRACDIGTNMTSLKAAAQFFNVKKLVAPTGVFTFYASISEIEILSPAKLAAKLKAAPDVRTFQGTKLVLIIHPRGFRAFAPAKGEGKAFIKNYIRSGYAGNEAPFVTGGLHPVGKTVVPGKKYVFPLEKEYKGLLATATP